MEESSRERKGYKEKILKIGNKYSQKRNCPASIPFRSCVCERFIYSHDQSDYSAAGKNMWNDPGNI
jgi:hypothetical protein